MSRLLDFYRGQGSDTEGRFLNEIWTWSDDDLEAVHDFIQWLFPLPAPSQFNPDAPLLTEDDIAAFKNDRKLQGNLQQSFERFLGFLGFAMSADGKVVESGHFSDRIPVVWASQNHNWLRITRILRSLTLLGMKTQAQVLYDRLEVYHKSRRFPFAATTFRYWTEALNDEQPAT